MWTHRTTIAHRRARTARTRRAHRTTHWQHRIALGRHALTRSISVQRYTNTVYFTSMPTRIISVQYVEPCASVTCTQLTYDSNVDGDAAAVAPCSTSATHARRYDGWAHRAQLLVVAESQVVPCTSVHPCAHVSVTSDGAVVSSFASWCQSTVCDTSAMLCCRCYQLTVVVYECHPMLPILNRDLLLKLIHNGHIRM